ncbi:hypothetical protein E1263_42240 [Kribbella antibiotica]|uniref:Uncharacterized protein n=1 Tax=Kribbella antibiotica TaxID=190195 RepID=A0A4R4YCH7_9ACTN|nr:hypothetical protein [Kribbella antibiotica]TDD42331.1 hypothetical protein E1263_42240 [Kribbella antibiotica]
MHTGLEDLPEPAELYERFRQHHPLDWGSPLPDKAAIVAESGTLATRRALELLAGIGWRDAAATAEMVALAGSGVELYQLKHRIKSPHSLARKIKSQTGKRQAAPVVEDAQRYTVAAALHDRLVDAAQRAAEHLLQCGWELTAVRNSYVDGSRYKGLHVTTLDPRGRRIEIQLHSRTSLAVKEGTTRPYEIARDRNLSPVIRDQARLEAVRLTETLKTPPGLAELTELGGCPVRVAGYGLGRESQRALPVPAPDGGRPAVRPIEEIRNAKKGREL